MQDAKCLTPDRCSQPHGWYRAYCDKCQTDKKAMLALTVEAAGGPTVPGYTSRGAKLLQAVTARQRAKAGE